MVAFVWFFSTVGFPQITTYISKSEFACLFFKSETIDIKIWTLHHSSFLKRLMLYGMGYTLGTGVTTAHKELILDMKCLEDIILSESVIM